MGPQLYAQTQTLPLQFSPTSTHVLPLKTMLGSQAARTAKVEMERKRLIANEITAKRSLFMAVSLLQEWKIVRTTR